MINKLVQNSSSSNSSSYTTEVVRSNAGSDCVTSTTNLPSFCYSTTAVVTCWTCQTAPSDRGLDPSPTKTETSRRHIPR
jgi:Tfp pilus assembly protein PilX